jgi:hypothetical protein
LTFLIGLLVTCSGRPIKNAKTLSNKFSNLQQSTAIPRYGVH